MDFRKPIPCPSCNNPKMNQGNIVTGKLPMFINKWCECGCKLSIVTAGNKDFEVTAKLLTLVI